MACIIWVWPRTSVVGWVSSVHPLPAHHSRHKNLENVWFCARIFNILEPFDNQNVLKVAINGVANDKV